MKCDVCFHNCNLAEGATGFCHARKNIDGKITPINYGKATALALDPIEKKPLRRFYPGSMILSYGSFGCNLRCPFCQNAEISMCDSTLPPIETRDISPEELVNLAISLKAKGNIGIAFTYNEPLVAWEYIRDVGKLSHDNSLVNVLVTNGTASPEVYEKISPYIDAMNIDLKGINDKYYNDKLQGNLYETLDFIKEAVKHCHVELTTLIIPGENDSDGEMEEIAGFISGLKDVFDGKTGADIPLHISRFFPRYHMIDRDATDVGRIYQLAEIAKKRLKYVYTGNC